MKFSPSRDSRHALDASDRDGRALSEQRNAATLCRCGSGARCEHADVLDAIWISAAEHVGLRVVISHHVYAAYDGRGTLLIGARETLDADDTVAQLVFHELCHSLVEGHDSFRCDDWGLDNVSTKHVQREHACLRLQAVLTDPWGMRRVFAPTTEFRAFYDALPSDPLTPRNDESVLAARIAAGRAERSPWAPHLQSALEATAALLGRETALHPSGFPLARVGTPQAHERCSRCAWHHVAPRDDGSVRCRHAEGAKLDASTPACERWEPLLDCNACGACCREAYDTVAVTSRDTIVHTHPDLVVRIGRRRELRRNGARCVALESPADDPHAYSCNVYEHRPRSCRDFERSGAHCLTARRKVGLTR